MGQLILITPENLSKNFKEVAIQVEQGAIIKLVQDGKTLHIVKDYDVALVTSTQKVSRLPKAKKIELTKPTHDIKTQAN